MTVFLALPDRLESSHAKSWRAGDRRAALRALPEPVDPRWSRPCIAAVAGLAAVLMAWSLTRNGYGNTYYASAVYAASRSWTAFAQGALDLSGSVSLDKTPLSVWMMALSVRVFGFGSLSLLLPNAICGVASVLVLHNVVKRTLGPRTAIVAALALATTPVMVVIGRFDNPDALLVLLLICSAWAATRAIESGRTRDLVLCGLLLGLAFNTKMLQAYLVLPGLAVAFLAAGPGRPRRRLMQLGIAAGVMVLVSFAWVLAMTLTPAGSRPWVGDTTTNSWGQLIFGANGVARLGAGIVPASPGGGTGLLRLFNAQNGAQIAWLMPLAALGLGAGLWSTRLAHRRDPRRAAFILWGSWAVVHLMLFSVGLKLFHPYYSSALAPAVAVLAASALVLLWDRRAASPWITALWSSTLLGSAALAILLLGRSSGFVPWLAWAVAALSAGAVLAAVARLRHERQFRHRGLARLAVGLAVLSGVAAPAAFSIATVNRAVTGIDPLAGPAPGGVVAARGRDQSEVALERYLTANRGRSTYLVAASGSAVAAQISIATRQPVVTMGGFGGTDPAPTALGLQKLVGSGALRFALLDAGPVLAVARAAAPGLGGDRARLGWVTTHCRALSLGALIRTPTGDARERLYDCGIAPR